MKTTCGFAAAVNHILLFILSETQRTLDSGAKLWAYLDDLYIWIKPHLALGATRTINVEMQPSKMQIWTASYTSPVPPAFLSKAKRTLKCFGSPSPHGW